MDGLLEKGKQGVRGLVQPFPTIQDMPPPTNFPPVRYERRIPNTGPSGRAIFGISALVMGYGFYLVGQGNHKRRGLKAEKQAARATLLPLLQAEEDRKFVADWNKVVAAEAYIMKDVPGWKAGASVYNNGKWYPPCTSTMPGSAPYS